MATGLPLFEGLVECFTIQLEPRYEVLSWLVDEIGAKLLNRRAMLSGLGDLRDGGLQDWQPRLVLDLLHLRNLRIEGLERGRVVPLGEGRNGKRDFASARVGSFYSALHFDKTLGDVNDEIFDGLVRAELQNIHETRERGRNFFLRGARNKHG